MTDDEIFEEIRKDSQAAGAGRGKILYVEGTTDVPILLGLLGAREDSETSRGVLHDGVLIRAVNGSNAVRRHVEVAERRSIPGISGVMDGDGRPLSELAARFDAPYQGPHFFWKGYCIENLLLRASWPSSWGDVPDWRSEFARFGPYVAINQVGMSLRRGRLRAAGLDQFQKPTNPLKSANTFRQQLRDARKNLGDFVYEAHFDSELVRFEQLLERGLDEIHTVVDGKWLVNTAVPDRVKRSHVECRAEWLAHLRATGGDPEILAWWHRTIAA